MSGFDFSSLLDPSNVRGQQILGAFQGLASAGMPTKAPSSLFVPIGAAIGGAREGAQSAQQFGSGQIDLANKKLGMMFTLARTNFFRKQAGLAPISMADIQSGKVSMDTPQGSQPPQQANGPSDGALKAPPPITSLYGNDPSAVVPAIKDVESGGDPNAVSPKGATGPMQVMPGTATDPGYGVAPAADASPQENQRVGADYFHAMVKHYNGNMTLGLIGYNMGPAKTDAWLKAGGSFDKLPPETQKYIGRVALGMSPPRGNTGPADGGISGGAPEPSPGQDGQSPSPMSGISELGMLDPESGIKALEKWSEPQVTRPGGAISGLDPASGQVKAFFKNPDLQKGMTFDDQGKAQWVPGAFEGEQRAAQMQAGTKAAADLAKEKSVAGYHNYLETGGSGLADASGNLKAGAPGTDQPQQGAAPQPAPNKPQRTAQGTIMPPVSEAAKINPSEKYLEKRIPEWAETENDWNDALPSGIIAEQRALAIAEALKATQSGHWAVEKADWAAKLKAVGIPINATERFLGDPAEVQKELKNNFQSTLQQIRAFSSRPAAIEVQLAAKNFANPDLQPGANLQIIGETVGTLRWERAMLNDWAAAKGQGWQDPQDFQRAWTKSNPIQGFIDKATKQIGPLKGMEGGPTTQPTGGAPKPAKQGSVTPSIDAGVQKQIDSLKPGDWSNKALIGGVKVDELKKRLRDKGYRVQ